MISKYKSEVIVLFWCCEVDPVLIPDTDRWTSSMWEVNTAGCWVIIWCCSHFYYSYSVFLLGLTNNSQRFFAADGRFNCHPLLVYESSYGSILVSSHNWRNLVSEPDQGKQGNRETETGYNPGLLTAEPSHILLNGLSSIHWLDFHLVTCVSYNIHTKTKELFIVNKCLNYNIVMREGRESNGFLFDWKGQGGWFFLHFRRRNIWTFWDVGETAGMVAGR